MTWTYQQGTGSFLRGNSLLGTGYSGFSTGRNNPGMEDIPEVGPIPRGKWKIGPAYDDKHLGPTVMHLDPDGHDAHFRTAFRIHGNNITNDASHGCIILTHDIRQMISMSDDRELEVVA